MNQSNESERTSFGAIKKPHQKPKNPKTSKLNESNQSI